jgi:hypothetical protein
MLCYGGVVVRDSIVKDGTTLGFVVQFLGKDIDLGNVCFAMDLCSKCMGSLNYCQQAIDQVLAVCKNKHFSRTFELILGSDH